ncbi:MAG: peptide chain release factor N(5)-glutamine methyltransferase [Magnetococcales bacterium]|nr:peptide chain release factor N(5)-glutamine methyltransferase [Magnetococcales bacterium]
MAGESWTVRKLLQWSTGWLGQKGVDSPRLDGELLLAEALKVRRLDLFLDPDRPMADDELARFRGLIIQRGKRMSVAHILGHRGFWSLELAVTHNLLVPRPETERLIEAALERQPDKEAQLTILDVGVGSGAILLALLNEWPQAVGYGVDKRWEAVACTRTNGQKLGVAKRCHLFQGDFLSALHPQAKFDFITSNPPYISQAESHALSPEIAQWEDPLAWYGGEDGLDAYRQIIPQALPCLLPNGWLLLEIGAGQGREVSELAEKAGFTEISTLQDYARRDRVVAARRPM